MRTACWRWRLSARSSSKPDVASVRQIEQFLETLPLETTDLGTIGPRLVRLCHALDHLTRLHDDLTRMPPLATDWERPSGFAAGARALAAWHEATLAPDVAPSPGIFQALEESSRQLGAERKSSRAQILEDIALQRTTATTARGSLDALVWADMALYHSWRLAESLRIAAE